MNQSFFVPTPAEAALPSFYSNNPLEGASRKDPKKVGALFEAIFYRMIFKEMRESELASEDLLSSSESKQARAMRDDELSNYLGAQGNLGVIDLLEKDAAVMESGSVVRTEDFGQVFGAPLGGLLKDERKS